MREQCTPQERERERERESFFFFPIQDIHKNDKLAYTRMINWWLLYNIELRQILLLHWILIFIFSQFIMSSIFRRKIRCYNIYFIIDIDQSCPRKFAMLVWTFFLGAYVIFLISSLLKSYLI